LAQFRAGSLPALVENLRTLRALCGLHAAEPVVDILLHLVLRVTVARLDLALELLAVAVDLREVIVGELAPLCFHLAGDLLPIACDAVQFMDGSSTLIEA
jgi:hypothetical protein